jgi:ATP-binding cassette subfamily B protein
MNYTLNKQEPSKRDKHPFKSLSHLVPHLKPEGGKLTLALLAMTASAAATLIAPLLISRTIDETIKTGDMRGLLTYALILFGIYILSGITEYLQTLLMGGVGRRVLFRLRNALFAQLQALPIAFFHQNKTGDLISRINNDTDRLNQFFAQALMQFLRSLFVITGAAVLLLSLHLELGIAVLGPAIGVLILTQIISPWVKRKNLQSLQSLGDMSAEIQESLDNIKVLIAFNRLDYFRSKFQEANTQNYTASVQAGYANNVFRPLYGFATNIAQLVALACAIPLIATGNLTIGLLIGFLFYVNFFYLPLQQLASVWSSFQQALAALDRIAEILQLESTLHRVPSEEHRSDTRLEFQGISFGYTDEHHVLSDISFTLEAGKTYAFVGPTGGGKTTIASLMARLYDPSSGMILLDGKDIRSYTEEERAQRIGFILQEPFLFGGSVLDNIFYGNEEWKNASEEKRVELLKTAGLFDLLSSFPQGLNRVIESRGEGISLGQRQLIAFIRAVLRKPDLLILDEATANIDTVTEQLLDQALQKLPSTTTKVVIAHRLNTIENADGIFFVSAGTVTPAGSLEHAVEMLLDHKTAS